MAATGDDPEKMARMRAWLTTVEEDLGIEHSILAEAETPLLDLISTVAHGPSRPGAPLTAFLIGVAVGRGQDATVLAERIESLARTHSE
ncbi:MAG: DUF6457 domain-containing protein [Actinomyces sp.]|nr:DUF6457 domain-containing protein [Actinomyces sp.]MDN6429345.1 DUF6457 domain-containing protein [Propionibacterium sp.]MDN6566260.1 DUF6457 domain-containing protein [Actinomyces sp.]MDN6795316.1 DUF6457 domain-containing protein [Propionibacterium sp.]